MREEAFRIAQKLGEISKRGDDIAALIRDLAENGDGWDVETIVEKLGGH